MSPEEVADEAAKLVQVLLEDAALRDWFDSLGAKSEATRSAELREMAAKMQAAGEETTITTITALLAEPPIFQAVQQALAEEMS